MDKGLRRLIQAVATTRLCYGEPVRQGDRTVIPVARVRVSGGWGWGRGPRAERTRTDQGAGEGGGGSLEGVPTGFIEIGPDGARFHEIPDPERVQRLVKAGAAAFTTVLTAAAGVRAVRAGRAPRGLLGRGR